LLGDLSGEINPNSQNVRLMVGTPSLHSGKVVDGSSLTMVPGEVTIFSAGLFRQSAANVSATVCQGGKRAGLSANEAQMMIP
jgi:hypothetical protein